MRKIEILILVLLLLCISGCSSANNKSYSPNIDTFISNNNTDSLNEEVEIESINIFMNDLSDVIYATETKKIKVEIIPSVDVDISWIIVDGENNATIINNEIYVKSSAPDKSVIIFYAKYNDIVSKRITLTVNNLDEQINIKKMEKSNYENQTLTANSQYNSYMNSYYQLESYCNRMGWIINGRDFDPTKRNEWSSTKSQMDTYYRLARNAESDADRYQRKVYELESEIEVLENKKAELRR